MQDPTYIIYGHESSYFSMKLVASFRLCGLSFKMHVPTARARERAGTHRIPVLEIQPQDWIVADTTHIIRAFMGDLYGHDAFSRSLLAFVEEFFDEYMPRCAVCQRWMVPENVGTAARRIALSQVPEGPASADEALVEQIATAVSAWGPRSCRALGVSDPYQRDKCLQELERIFGILECHMVDGRYVLGSEWPTAVDAVVLGSLRAHFFYDVKGLDPAKYPKLHKLCLRVFEGQIEQAPSKKDPLVVSPVVEELLGDEAMRNFVSIAMANAAAIAAKEKTFTLSIYGQRVSLLARREPCDSLVILLHAITTAADSKFALLLKSHNLILRGSSSPPSSSKY